MLWQRVCPLRYWARFEHQAAKHFGLVGRHDFNFDLGCQLQRAKVFAGHALAQWFFAGPLLDYADMRFDHDARHARQFLSADGPKRYF